MSDVNVSFGGDEVTVSFEDGLEVPVTFGSPLEVPVTFAATGAARDVVDNLLSTRTDAALSANMGRALGNEDSSIREDVGNDNTDFAAYFNSLLT